jgi:hypothetical protein
LAARISAGDKSNKPLSKSSGSVCCDPSGVNGFVLNRTVNQQALHTESEHVVARSQYHGSDYPSETSRTQQLRESDIGIHLRSRESVDLSRKSAPLLHQGFHPEATLKIAARNEIVAPVA